MNKKSILLVEDNPSDVALTRIVFQRENITGELTIARDGVEAVELLSGKNRHGTGEEKYSPDLILLDLKLPRMDGFSVLDWIRSQEHTRHVPVVILTTSNDEQAIARSFCSGANDFIRKTPEFSEFSTKLSKAVRDWVAGQKDHDPVAS